MSILIVINIRCSGDAHMHTQPFLDLGHVFGSDVHHTEGLAMRSDGCMVDTC